MRIEAGPPAAATSGGLADAGSVGAALAPVPVGSLSPGRIDCRSIRSSIGLRVAVIVRGGVGVAAGRCTAAAAGFSAAGASRKSKTSREPNCDVRSFAPGRGTMSTPPLRAASVATLRGARGNTATAHDPVNRSSTDPPVSRAEPAQPAGTSNTSRPKPGWSPARASIAGSAAPACPQARTAAAQQAARRIGVMARRDWQAGDRYRSGPSPPPAIAARSAAPPHRSRWSAATQCDRRNWP